MKVPLVIDTTDPAVMERALRWCPGKSLLNSVNLEDGRERLDRVVPLARRYGAALVVGLIDEDRAQGMAVTLRAEDGDRPARARAPGRGVRGRPRRTSSGTPLTFPCGTGDANYRGSARATIEGVRALKAAFPRTKTVLGISNVSFGLPEGGREVLNSVFLYHAVLAGLDLAIVNAERLERYPTIPEAERLLCEDLLFDRGADPVAAFTAHFRDARPAGAAAARRPHARRADRGLHHRGHEGRAPGGPGAGPRPPRVPGRPRS